MMLSTFLSIPDLPIFIEGFIGKPMKLGKEDWKGVRVGIRIDPFTAEHAGDLSSELKAALFARTTGQVKDLIAICRPAFAFHSQRVTVRVDPSLEEPSIVLPDVRIVPRPLIRLTPDGTFLFRAQLEIHEIAAMDLLYLKEAAGEQRFLTFERSEPGFFDAIEAAERRKSKHAAPVRPSRQDDPLPLDDMPPMPRSGGVTDITPRRPS
jgi:hypothetical protein